MTNPAVQHPTGSPSAETGMPAASSLANRIGLEIRRLYPGYFALVMATGIISNAALHIGHRALSDFLLGVNLIAFPLLALAAAIRASRFSREFWKDLANPRLVFSFFTIVAAANVFELQLVLRGYAEPGIALCLFALIVWVALAYLSFSLSLAADFPPLQWVPHVMIWVALAAWALPMIGTLAACGRVLRPSAPLRNVERGSNRPYYARIAPDHAHRHALTRPQIHCSRSRRCSCSLNLRGN